MMKTRRLPQQSTAGFTLLEVLAVVVIIGVLMAIAAPGWLAFMNNQRANSGRDQVLQALRVTQSEAKRQRRARGVEFLTANDVPAIEMNGILEELGQGEFVPGSVGLSMVDADDTEIDTLVFREDGTVSVEANDYDDFGANPPQLPVTIAIAAPPESGNPRCVVIDTILGSMYSISGDDAADDNCGE